jgi:predicted metal-dependent hydrolase
MSVAYKMQYGTQPIEFTVVRRERRTMQISVLPDSSVEVVAPVSAHEKDIVARMNKRAGWICKQIRFFQQYQPRTPDRRFVAGETHLYLGRRYRLKIVRSEQSAIKLKRGFIEVHKKAP